MLAPAPSVSGDHYRKCRSLEVCSRELILSDMREWETMLLKSQFYLFELNLFPSRFTLQCKLHCDEEKLKSSEVAICTDPVCGNYLFQLTSIARAGRSFTLTWWNKCQKFFTLKIIFHLTQSLTDNREWEMSDISVWIIMDVSTQCWSRITSWLCFTSNWQTMFLRCSIFSLVEC